MNYITHKRFKQKGMTGETHNLPYGTELILTNNTLYYNSTPICYSTSENGHKYFSRNDDNNGLERGKLTYAIAYSDRRPNKNNGFRFTEEEREMIREEYPHFLQDNEEWLLFNHDFFNADIKELRELANKLEVH